MIKTAIRGIFINPTESKTLEVHNDHYLLVDENGFIVDLVRDINEIATAELIDRRGQLILPGLIDCHTHFPQFSFAGIGNGTLLNWLNNYTFPTEERYQNPEVCKEHATIFFDNLVKNGTSTAVIYLTSKFESSELAFEAAEKCGLRVIMGQVLMDRNSNERLLLDPDQAIIESERLIKNWHGYGNNRIQYALSPRFAISCSEKLMKMTGVLAEKYDCYIQTHLAENKQELLEVRKLFPEYKTYTEIYERAGLLNEKTLLGHCIYMSDEELVLIKRTNSKMIHCPSSNRFLSSGIFPFRNYNDLGIDIALGSDVAGGYSLNMLNELKEAIETSKYISMEKNTEKILSIEEGIYHISLGAAKVLSLDSKLGSFDKGKEADFLIINDNEINPYLKTDFFQNPIERLQRTIYNASSAVVGELFLRGKCLYGNL